MTCVVRDQTDLDYWLATGRKCRCRWTDWSAGLADDSISSWTRSEATVASGSPASRDRPCPWACRQCPSAPENKKQIEVPGGLDGSSCSLPCGESVRGLFGSSLMAELGLLAWELDSSDVTGPGVSINMWPMCVTCGPFELDVEFPLDDSVNGFSLSISCGFEPDTGRLRRFNSTLRSLTERIALVTVNRCGGRHCPCLIDLSPRLVSSRQACTANHLPFMSSSLPRGLKGGCSEGLLEEFEGAGLGAFMLLPLMLPASLAPLLFKDSGFCAAVCWSNMLLHQILPKLSPQMIRTLSLSFNSPGLQLLDSYFSEKNVFILWNVFSLHI
ncbi:hypothetical protein WN51_07771 [Melipona quadrifasciata]|uniref:Uncharacterized protein n=1 Tax=Melipona quadrifasciata TaxID=166423 RepID=A0A0M9A6Q0_9HYME|nr:hypothetical protein WN51_07771 [Melipona quadrifasciata]